MSEQHEPWKILNDQLEWMREQVRWMREHPGKTLFWGTLASLIATVLWQLWGGRSAPVEEIVGSHMAGLRQGIEELRQDLDRSEDTQARKLAEIERRANSHDQRISRTEGFEHEIRRLDQWLDMELPVLESRTNEMNNKVIGLETGAESMKVRIGHLENGSSHGRTDGRILAGKVDTALGQLRLVEERTRRLETSVENLHRGRGDGHHDSRVAEEIESIREEILELGTKMAELEARLHTGKLRPSFEGTGAGSLPTARSTAEPAARAPVKNDSAGKVASACGGPVDPKVPAGEVDRPELDPDPPEPRHPSSHPPILRDLKLELCLTIGRDGKVREVRILDGQEIHRTFHREAISAALLWRFEPARWQGKNIEWRQQVAVVFKP